MLEAESTPRAIVRSEGFYVNENPMKPSGIEPRNFRLYLLRNRNKYKYVLQTLFIVEIFTIIFT